MAVVGKGSKTNLIVGYAEGEDNHVNYGRNRWLAQTFTLDDLYVVWRFRFKAWTIHAGHPYQYAIRATDGAGKPTGPDLVDTGLSPTGEAIYSPGKWRRFDFISFPNLPAGTYALIARRPAVPSWQDTKLRCDATAPTYAGGKAWLSHNQGVDWEEIPDTDFMFEVWGWKPPPIIDTAPVISNWAPLTYYQPEVPECHTITITTDIPVHLFLRWTDKEPLKHPLTEYRRGIYVPIGTRYCFVAWKEVEQEEAGDTLTHTFILCDWLVCETRWFYVIGTKQAEESPSASPLLYYHRKGVEMYVISLGKFGEAEVLHGEVKLKEGANITITRDDPDNALEIATAATPYEGFRNHWLKFDPDGAIAGSLNWSFDEVNFAVSAIGTKGALYTESLRTWGLVSPHSCQFKITRGITGAGAPYGWFCMAKTDPDIHNNPLQEHIGFRAGADDKIYCTNADGVARTQTATGIVLWPPRWVKWVRTPASILFYVDGVLVATHNTNLPTLTNSAFFTFMMQGASNFPRELYMSCPMLGID